MRTREWVAVHRKHHARCETADDPHSPAILGINRVLWGGVFLYVKEAAKRDTLERFGYGTPDDWLERNLYSKYVLLGLTLMGVTDVILFGIVPGVLIFLTQIAWIPFWAAGVINGAGHHWGYKRLAPVPRFIAAKPLADLQTLQAVIANRYHVLASYAASLKRLHVEELVSLQTMKAMRHELVALWTRSMATHEQLVRRLQDWCQRAEASGIAPLAEFSRRLRSYA